MAECNYQGSFCGDTGCETHGIGPGPQPEQLTAEERLRIGLEATEGCNLTAAKLLRLHDAALTRIAKAVELLEDVNRYERADDFAQTILEVLK